MRAFGAIVVVAACVIPVRAVLAQQGVDDRLPYSAADDQTRIDWSDEIPAHVAAIDGILQIDRDGVTERGEENAPLLAGDRLRTDRARAEVLFGDGSALAIDQLSDVDLLSDALIRVSAGRIRLLIARSATADYRVDAAGTTTTFRGAGEYEISIDDRTAAPDVRVKVIRGGADFASAEGSTFLGAGYESRATASRYPSTPYSAIVTSVDAFDRWVDDLHGGRAGVRSAQYLPDNLRIYSGAFDRDGEWLYERGYGYVWYPRVAYDWQPYYNGRWAYVGSFGWTWVGAGSWTWPTHHYGRWGISGTRWFWIPERRWAPAWVSWAGTPGYVSWCPLGYDNRPVFSVGVFYSSTPWRGWTVVPSTLFVSSFAVRSHALAPRAYAFSGGSRFATRAAPARPSGIRAASTTAYRSGPRVAAPRYGAPRSTMTQTSRAATAPRAPGTTAPGTAARRWDPSSVQRLGGAAAPRSESTSQPFSRTSRRIDAQQTPAARNQNTASNPWRAQVMGRPPQPAAPSASSRVWQRSGNGVELPNRARPQAAPGTEMRQERRGARAAPPAASRSSEGRHASEGSQSTGRHAGKR
jgi:hypothetical protein